MPVKPKKTKKTPDLGSPPRWRRGDVNLSSGWRRPQEEFGAYGDAFRRAGKELTQSLNNNPAYHPLDVCPIVFLYRQAVELYAKAILRVGQHLFDLDSKTLSFNEPILVQHRLSPFLAPLRELYDELGWSNAYQDCADFVGDLEAVDPISFAFRYPVDKANNSALPEDLVFNVVDFATRAERVLDVMYEVLHGIEHRIDDAHEMLSNLDDG
jgi:hypothetical protein